MCGRYVSPDTAAIEAAWHIGRGNANPFAQRFNVLPTTDIPVIRFDPETAKVELTQARWGFIPGWWKERKPPSACFNARSEEAASKPMWREAWRKWRCLIPACGWFEWQAAQRTDADTGEVQPYKQPHFIYRPDRKPICFAGLISYRATADGSGQLSCAIVTRNAAPSLARVHDRMPVILPEEIFSAWLDPRPKLPAEVQALVGEAQDEFSHHPVTTRLNSARTDEPEFVSPVA